MEVKAENYQGPERRNGSKLRLSFKDWKWIISFIFIAGGLWAVLNFRVSLLAQDSEKAEIVNIQQTKDITEIKKDIGYIKENIDEIKETNEKVENKLEVQSQVLYKILGKLNEDD